MGRKPRRRLFLETGKGTVQAPVVLKVRGLMHLSSLHLQNQLGADQPEAGGNGQSGRTGDNDGNYDGGRQAGNFDASGTSTPAYRQEDGELGSREV